MKLSQRYLPAIVLASFPTGLGAAPVRPADGCAPNWIPEFGGAPGLGQRVQALATFDDGTGEALYVGGSFATAGGIDANRVARWDGSGWSPLGSGLDAPVRALAVFDDGDGPRLYAGGVFSSAGGAPASRVACWDGASWSPVGSGTDGAVDTLAVLDLGDGPKLYAGGAFTSAGGAPASHVARWDGASWSALGSGVDGDVLALAACDLDDGAELFAAGSFWTAGGLPVGNVARWNGASWSALGTGMNAEVRALSVFDDGSGSALYAGGAFSSAGSVAAQRIARWDGASWSAMGSGMNAPVYALTVFDDGGGARLYAGGAFGLAGGAAAVKVARWDGAIWSAAAGLGAGIGGVEALQGAALQGDQGPAGPALFAAGGIQFIESSSAGATSAYHIARFDGASWSTLGSGCDYPVRVLGVFDYGSGPALHAVRPARLGNNLWVDLQVERWNGGTWEKLGAPFSNTVVTLVVHDDGSGPALYAGGTFSGHVARWNGTTWSQVGFLGPFINVQHLFSFDDGSGPVLLASGPNQLGYIGIWDGTSWGVTDPGSSCSPGYCSYRFGMHDDGSGPKLIVADGAGRVCRWDRPSWTELGTGMNGTIYAFASFDDGSGPALYAGGSFTQADGSPANNLARWDGSSWIEVAGGVDGAVLALAVYDDGAGPGLYAGGVFQNAGGLPASRVARWDGSAWSPLGDGVPGAVSALAVFDGDPLAGPWLAVAGSSVASPARDSYIARWHGCPDSLAPTIVCPEERRVLDGPSDPGGESVTFTVTASDFHDPAPTVVCMPPSGSFFPLGTTVVRCEALDASGNLAIREFPVTVLPKARRR